MRGHRISHGPPLDKSWEDEFKRKGGPLISADSRRLRDLQRLPFLLRAHTRTASLGSPGHTNTQYVAAFSKQLLNMVKDVEVVVIPLPIDRQHSLRTMMSHHSYNLHKFIIMKDTNGCYTEQSTSFFSMSHLYQLFMPLYRFLPNMFPNAAKRECVSRPCQSRAVE